MAKLPWRHFAKSDKNILIRKSASVMISTLLNYNKYYLHKNKAKISKKLNFFQNRRLHRKWKIYIEWSIVAVFKLWSADRKGFRWVGAQKHIKKICYIEFDRNLVQKMIGNAEISVLCTACIIILCISISLYILYLTYNVNKDITLSTNASEQ